MDILKFTDCPVGIFINGIALTALLQEYEAPMAQAEGHAHLAGAYGPLTPYELYKSMRKAGGKCHPSVAVLDCRCGCSGCWTLELAVIKSADAVLWCQFKQIHRNQPENRWDYSNFGPFRFSLQQYAEQMGSLKQQARISRAQARGPGHGS